MNNQLILQTPNEKQKLFLSDHHKHVAYGGARGGGKSWCVRDKAKRLSLRYAGIKILIVRRTFPELVNNHINQLRGELHGIARYNKTEKVFTFPNGSTIKFGYCATDGDLDQYQGAEYDVIFLDEATQLQESPPVSVASMTSRSASTIPATQAAFPMAISSDCSLISNMRAAKIPTTTASSSPL